MYTGATVCEREIPTYTERERGDKLDLKKQEKLKTKNLKINKYIYTYTGM